MKKLELTQMENLKGEGGARNFLTSCAGASVGLELKLCIY